MIKLKVSKKDLKIFLPIILLVPMLSFVGGFTIAKALEPNLSDQLEHLQVALNAIAKPDAMLDAKQASEESIVSEAEEVTVAVQLEDDVNSLQAVDAFEKSAIQAEDELQEIVTSISVTLPVKERAADERLVEEGSRATLPLETPQSNSQELSYPVASAEVFSEEVYAVQAGIFQFYENAYLMQIDLLDLGIESKIITSEVNENSGYRVILERFENRQSAIAGLRVLRSRYSVPLALTEFKQSRGSVKLAAN